MTFFIIRLPNFSFRRLAIRVRRMLSSALSDGDLSWTKRAPSRRKMRSVCRAISLPKASSQMVAMRSAKTTLSNWVILRY